ncbi:MAG: ATP-dependent DNA helicase [Desulfomonilaceae bacterium]
MTDALDKIKAIFAPKGILAQAIPNYEFREQQYLMALDVFRTLSETGYLLIEAPTGTGKTLAYLVAAALTRKKIAVSTGTKNLQEQLFFKDAPFVRTHLFPQLKVALLKGRGNFVCHAQVKKFLKQIHIRFVPDADHLDEIMAWYRQTRKNGEGDRVELAHLPEDDGIWPEICSSTETCLGKHCPDKDECFVQRMKSKAMDADLMIVNHHLLCSDAAVRESGFGEVIPRYEALIVDEAHGLEDAATKHFGVQSSLFKLQRLVRDATAELRAQKIADRKFDEALTNIDEDSRELFQSLARSSSGQGAALGSLDPRVREKRQALCTRLDSLASMLSNLPKCSEECRNLARRCEQASSDLNIILQDQLSGDYACWSERRDRHITIYASPVDVGPLLKSTLYSRVDSIVFTSATLSSNADFSYFKSRLGLDGALKVREKMLATPFDYSSQTMLFIPRNMPDPNSEGFTEAIAGVLPSILEKTRGRAFVLFTSYRNMEAVYRRLKEKLPFPLLLQGTKAKHKLLEEFRSMNGSVLLATASFWEGVDVQGEALSCVIVDKLPFASPTDPLVAARIEKLKKEQKTPFFDFQVPMAVIALKQGLGRLIRTRSDRGVLCILDQRILTKSYGQIFLKSLYSCPLKRDITDIDKFFASAESARDGHKQTSKTRD